MRKRRALGLFIGIVAGCSSGDPKVIIARGGASGGPTSDGRDADTEAEGFDAPDESAGDASGRDEPVPPALPDVDLADNATIGAADRSDGGALDPGAYTGIWIGTTSQDRAIRFVADAPGIGDFEYGWVLGPCASTTHVVPGAPVPILNGRVQGTFAGSPSVTFTIVFDTASTASGTLDITKRPDPNVPGCATQASATFVATKQ